MRRLPPVPPVPPLPAFARVCTGGLLDRICRTGGGLAPDCCCTDCYIACIFSTTEGGVDAVITICAYAGVVWASLSFKVNCAAFFPYSFGATAPPFLPFCSFFGFFSFCFPIFFF